MLAQAQKDGEPSPHWKAMAGPLWDSNGQKLLRSSPLALPATAQARLPECMEVLGRNGVSVKCKNLGRHRGYWQNQKDIEGSGPLASSWLICCQEISKATRYLACRSDTSSELQWKCSIFKSAHTVCDTEMGLPGFQASQKEHAQLKVDCKCPGINDFQYHANGQYVYLSLVSWNFSFVTNSLRMQGDQPQRDQQSQVFLYQKQSQRWSHILNSAALLSWKHGLTYESRFGFSKPLAIA